MASGAGSAKRLGVGVRSVARLAAKPLLHGTRLPLPQWEMAVAHLVMVRSAAALSLQRDLELGSYRTAWRMARIIREVLAATEWPPLSGEVEFCDVNLAKPPARRLAVWFAVERRAGVPGLIRAWRVSGDLRADFERAAGVIGTGATVITPKAGWFRELRERGLRQRGEALGTAEALPAVAKATGEFRRMLSARRHHGIAVKTLDSYLGEFVFRHNAAVLGWSVEEQCRRVMAALHAPRPSA